MAISLRHLPVTHSKQSMRKLTLNLNVRDKSAVLMLNPSSFVWQSKYKRCSLKSSAVGSGPLPPSHPLRSCRPSAAPARLVHQGQLPSSSLGVSARTSLGALSLARPAPRACPPRALPRPIRRRNRPSQFGKTHTHSTAAPSRPLASAYDPAAQQPAQGSTMQAGAVGGVGGLGGRWRCSSGPRYLERRHCVPLLFVNGPSVVCFAPPARTPLCFTTQAAIGRTAAHDGRARRCLCVGRRDRRQPGPVMWPSFFLCLSFGRSIGRPGARERRTAERASALTDARVATTPKGLNLGAGLVPGVRGRAAAGESGARRRTSASQQRPYNCTAKAAEFPSSL